MYLSNLNNGGAFVAGKAATNVEQAQCVAQRGRIVEQLASNMNGFAVDGHVHAAGANVKTDADHVQSQFAGHVQQ